MSTLRKAGITGWAALRLVAAPDASGQSFPLTGTSLSVTVRPVVRGQPLGVTVDGTVRPDGSVCLVDYSSSRVSCFATDGKLLWHFGRRGAGPGEFQVPYRIATTSTGKLLVYDLANRRITTVSSEGRYEGSRELGLGLSPASSILSVDDTTLFVSGYAPGAGTAADSAVHSFNQRGGLTGSFAPLPFAKDKSVLGYFGAGSIMRWGASVAYIRRIPYEIIILDRNGHRLARYAIPARVSSSADEAFATTTQSSSRTVTASHAPFIAPGAGVQLQEDLFIVARLELVDGKATAQWWDAISSTGRLLGSTSLPPSLIGAGPIGTTSAGSTIWLTGEDSEGEPVLYRADVSSKGVDGKKP